MADDTQKFRDDVDKVNYGLGDGAGPSQYPNERRDESEPFTPEVEIVDTEDDSITPEVHVVVDEVTPMVTHNDPAGYGSLDLPIHGWVGAKTVEEQFADAAKSDDGAKDKAPAKAASSDKS